MDTDKVSIIIPCYNDVQYIVQSVNSALAQTYSNIEVIVIDDGSDHETKAILKKLESTINKLIIQDNRGQASARNAGIKVATGKYILTLDSDDYLEPTLCEKAVRIFQETTDVKIVTCHANLHFINNTIQTYIPDGGTIANFKYFNGALGTSLFKKDDFEKVGGYDENMRQGFEDWEFFIRILETGGCVTVISESLYNYRKRKDSTTEKANAIKYELLFYILKKHKDIYINDYDNLIFYFLDRIKREEQEKLKYSGHLDNKIGKIILKPFRIIKSFLK